VSALLPTTLGPAAIGCSGSPSHNTRSRLLVDSDDAIIFEQLLSSFAAVELLLFIPVTQQVFLRGNMSGRALGDKCDCQSSLALSSIGRRGQRQSLVAEAAVQSRTIFSIGNLTSCYTLLLTLSHMSSLICL
jgi:hypothetical protein